MKFLPLGRLLAAVVLVASSAGASAYSNLVIFGDSLSDSGNNALLIGIDAGQVITGNSYIPTFAYASGTYSNASVWATSFAAGLGLQALPSLAGGTNYAYGGAVTSGSFPPSLQAQVAQYLGGATGSASDTLFVIAGGGNNARAALEAVDGGAPILRTVIGTALRYANDVGGMVDSLQAVGAQHIVVWNAPNLGGTPAVQAAGSDASFLGTVVASAMNNALARRLDGETGVTTFDLFGLLGTAIADPAAFGLTNVSDACGAVLGCDPSTYLFWDGIHPTSAGHALLSNAMFETLGITPVPEPATAWLLLLGAGVVFVRRRRAALQ